MKNRKKCWKQIANTITLVFEIEITAPPFIASAQTAPPKQWDATLGGSGSESLRSLQQTADGGYILGGDSYSGISGDKTQASQGENDYWIVKTDINGVKQWDATFGGSYYEDFWSLQQTADGGYILGGESWSGISGDKTQESQGYIDYWIVKTDSDGVKQWDARFGGSDYDHFSSLQQTADGGYILGGYSGSGISGDKTQESQGWMDYWIVKTDANGVKQWDARFGGSYDDYLWSLQQTADGGYILGGESNSGITGDKTQANWDPSFYTHDYWIVKTDSNGVKQWDATFGGSDDDFFLSSLQQTADGGYILGGESRSGISGDKTQACQGDYDYWIVKTDANGIKQWDARFGGNNYDPFSSLQQTADGGYILGGSSLSGISGDKTQASQGGGDYWIVKTDATGVKQWDVRFGGSEHDWLTSLQQTVDGGYILGGESYSEISGDKTQACQDEYDYWIVKVAPECNGLTFYADEDSDSYGDATNSLFVADCLAPCGYVLDSADCDDSNTAVNPAALEICDGIDNNCDGNIDEGLLLTFYFDADGDTYGNGGNSTLACSLPYGYVTDNTDCDDNNALIHPGALEICNSIDDNCNGQTDEGVQSVFYADNDIDGYGTSTNFVLACSAPAGYVSDNTDCDDSNALIHPGAIETCNGIDDNCINGIDEGLAFITYYQDADGDSYGNPLVSDSACNGAPIGFVTDNTDCDDNNPNVYPGAQEITNNGIDDNCNGVIDEFGVGINEVLSPFSLLVIPNPAQDHATIQFTLPQSSHVSIKVYDVSGKEIATLLDDDVDQGDHSLLLNTNYFSKGVYLVKMISPAVLRDGIENQKLIVQ